MILIDSNQASMDSELYDLLRSKTKVIVTPLDTGDLVFSGKINQERVRVGIELKKSPSDLIASLRDGRLITQLPRMTNEFDLPILVTIGEADRINVDKGFIMEKMGNRWRDSAFSYNYLNSILSRFEASGGRVRHVRDVRHLVYFVMSLMKWWHKNEHQEEVFYRERHKFLDWKLLDNPLMEMYERMGIGIKRAGVLAEKYPSLIKLVTAEKSELLALEGFGKKTVDKVMEFIEGK